MKSSRYQNLLIQPSKTKSNGEYDITSRLIELFNDKALEAKINRVLPYLFQLAEMDCSRAGRIGMEIGCARERILTALLVHVFGENNIDANIPTTETEVDLKLFGYPISIKTITGSGGVKMVWTVDAASAERFLQSYEPTCDLLLAQIAWSSHGRLVYVPLDVQRKVLAATGRQNYIKKPKEGTNPRGVEYSKEALARLIHHPQSKSMLIYWKRSTIDYKPFERWLIYWEKDNSGLDTLHKSS